MFLDDDDTLPDVTEFAQDVTLLTQTELVVASWGASSSLGRIRECNEDRYGHADTVFVIADGIGGHVGGAEAASFAVEQVLGRGSLLGQGAPLDEWSSMVRSVSDELRSVLQRRGLDGAGTTLTMVSIEPDRVVGAHVGDSRLYEFTMGVLRQRTSDHNLRNEMLSVGQDLDEAIGSGKRLDALVSFVGLSGGDLRVDVFSWLPASGSRLLLSTDGVHGCLSHTEVAAIVSYYPAAEAASRLTSRADETGGRDNATAVVVEL